MNKVVYIFDIDGCILPSIFPKLLKKNQTKEKQDKLIKEINEKGTEIELYPKFLEFYFKKCSHELVYFVTGRKRSNFEKLTYHHLSSLQYENIYFYPEDGPYTLEFYLTWKYNIIKSLFEKDREYLIFDDEDRYFDELESIEQHDCKCFKVESNYGWDTINLVFGSKKLRSILWGF